MRWSNWLKFRDTKECTEEVVEKVIPLPLKPIISEPVLTIVQCVKDNPKRFKCKIFETGTSVGITTYTWIIVDLLTKEGLHAYQISDWYNAWDSMPKLSCAWMSEEEKVFVVDELLPVFQKKQERYCQIKQERANRSFIKERQRIMGVYCEKE